MRTLSMPWLHALLLVSAVFDQPCALETPSSLHGSEMPLLGHLSPRQLRLPRLPSDLIASTALTHTTRAVPRQSIVGVPARYATNSPRTFSRHRLTPTMDGYWELKPRPFIGPRQAFTPALPLQTPDASLSSVPSLTPIFSLSRNSQTLSTMNPMPYQEHEYERMDNASHVILHGGN